MTDYLHILTIVTGIVTTLLAGVMVYQANPGRAPNRQLLITSILIALHFGSMLLAFQYYSKGVEWHGVTEIYIRACCVIGMAIFASFDLLRRSISEPKSSLLHMLRTSPHWILLVLVSVVLAVMPDFIHGFVEGALVPEPNRGLPFKIYDVVLLTAGLTVIVRLFVDSRTHYGMQQTEFHYMMIGIVTCLLVGLSCAVVFPLLTQRSTAMTYLPICAIIMNCIIAYGIAAHRILGAGEFLRKTTAYTMITAYLVAMYGGTFLVVEVVMSSLNYDIPNASHLVAALVVAFSFAPANGMLQRFANTLFINLRPFSLEETMRDAGRVLQSLKTIDELLHEFCQIVSNAIGSDHIRVLLCQEGIGYVEHYPIPAAAGIGMQVHMDAEIVDALRDNNSVISADVLQRMRSSERIERIRTWMKTSQAKLAVGIHYKGKLQGILLLGNRLSGRIYSRADQDALQVLANQLGVSLENARLYSEVRQSKLYSESLLQNLVSGVIAVNPEGVIQTFNDEARRITGLDRSEVVERNFTELPAPLTECIRRALQSKEAVRDVEATIESLHNEFIVRVGSSLFFGEDRRLMGVLVVFHDVTAIRRLENQVRRNDRLASVGTIAAGMAHEIKNPLVAIKTFTQLLPERYDEADFRETFFNIIGGEVHRIDTIVNRLLHFARPSPPILTDVRMHDLINGLRAFLEHEFRKRNIKVEQSLDAENDLLRADPNKIEQALLNLVLNSLDAMGEGGTFTIKTKTRESHDSLDNGCDFVVELSDTGCGIDKIELDKIFDPFFTTKNEGTGLGLSVTLRIVEEHRGRIEVDSIIGQGTTFRMEFPIGRMSEEVELANAS